MIDGLADHCDIIYSLNEMATIHHKSLKECLYFLKIPSKQIQIYFRSKALISSPKIAIFEIQCWPIVFI